MKKLIFFAFAATFAVGGAFAKTLKTVPVQKDGTYTYYLEGQCDVPEVCSDDFSGQACSIAFSGIRVYNAPNCIDGNETTIILGKRP